MIKRLYLNNKYAKLANPLLTNVTGTIWEITSPAVGLFLADINIIVILIFILLKPKI